MESMFAVGVYYNVIVWGMWDGDGEWRCRVYSELRSL